MLNENLSLKNGSRHIGPWTVGPQTVGSWGPIVQGSEGSFFSVLRGSHHSLFQVYRGPNVRSPSVWSPICLEPGEELMLALAVPQGVFLSSATSWLPSSWSIHLSRKRLSLTLKIWTWCKTTVLDGWMVSIVEQFRALWFWICFGISIRVSRFFRVLSKLGGMAICWGMEAMFKPPARVGYWWKITN